MSLLATDAATCTGDQFLDVEAALNPERPSATGTPCHRLVATVYLAVLRTAVVTPL